ncbi:flavodoxin [Candidatus Saccharibacteria bacterium]|nr:flavodoxin [Candidatus Saccharibacteria bacterium]
MDKKLVVYFSRGDEEYGVGSVNPGNTELIAKEIIAKTGADEFKIVPVKKYPKTYMDCVDQATHEKETQARPAYEGDIDISAYGTIFLGYPIWWGDLPMIVYTFLENHDFADKKIIPFNTHEGSGNAGTYGVIKAKLSSSEVIGDGFNLAGTVARTEEGIKQVDNWLMLMGH